MHLLCYYYINAFFFFFSLKIAKRASDGIQASPMATSAIASSGNHARSTSYSVSYCAKKTANLPMEVKGW